MKDQKPYWVDAKTLKGLTGWSDTQMFWQRKKNPEIWKENGKRGYIYDLNKIPQVLLKEKA